MAKRDDLRGYLLAMAFGADDPLGLSSEDIHSAFKEAWPDASDFGSAFEDALIWLRDEGLVRYDQMYSGTNDEACVADLVATAKGERAFLTLADEPTRSGGLHIELARMVGAGLGEFTKSLNS